MDELKVLREAVNAARTDYDEKRKSLMRAFTDDPTPDTLSAAKDEGWNAAIETCAMWMDVKAKAKRESANYTRSEVTQAIAHVLEDLVPGIRALRKPGAGV